MIQSVGLTLFTIALACLPGLLFSRGQHFNAGQKMAVGALSIVFCMIVTTLCGLAASAVFGTSIPAWSFLIVSAAVCVMCFALPMARTTSASSATQHSEWPVLIFVTLFAAIGLFVQSIGIIEQADGSLALHGWFNADWFKHLGHVSGIANFGLPASDNFQGGETLHYYWLFYLLPGSVTSIAGSHWQALQVANVVCAGALAALIYFSIRNVCTHRTLALVISICSVFVFAPMAFIGYAMTAEGIEAVRAIEGSPRGPALIHMTFYIPHHASAVIMYLSWLVLHQADDAIPKPVKYLALFTFASVLTVSTLVGAMLLTAYGLQRLYEDRLKAFPELITMVVLCAIFAVAFGVVQVGNPVSAIESPLLTDPGDPAPEWIQVMGGLSVLLGGMGLPLIIGLIVMARFHPLTPATKSACVTGVALITAACVGVVGSELILSDRLAREVLIRSGNLAAIGLAIYAAAVMGYYWLNNTENRQKSRRYVIATLAVVSLAGIPSTTFNIAWHGNIGDVFTTYIPADDRAVLAALREKSAPDALVWQFPEPPIMGDPPGGDIWATTIAGRAVPASLRATNYPAAAPKIEHVTRFFAGEDVAIPDDVDWVYLSRILRNDTYDSLKAKMDGNSAWKQAACYADACLFERVDTAAP